MLIKKKQQQPIINNPTIKYSKYIYVEVDDCFGKIRNNKGTISKWKNRLIVIHNGKDKNNKINKITLLESKEVSKQNYSMEELATIIKNKINEFYTYDELILIGDGAKWMKALAKHLNCKFILDHFHWKKLVQKIIGYKKYNTKNKKQFSSLQSKYQTTFYKYIIDLIESNQLEQAINELKSILNEIKLSSSKIDEIKYLINHLRQNKQYIRHFNKEYYIGSRTEAFVNNIVKQKTKIKHSIYGFETFKALVVSSINKHLTIEFI